MDIREHYLDETFLPDELSARGSMFPRNNEVEISLEWCEQELGYRPKQIQFGYFYRFYFEDAEDMMAYKLRWA